MRHSIASLGPTVPSPTVRLSPMNSISRGLGAGADSVPSAHSASNTTRVALLSTGWVSRRMSISCATPASMPPSRS